MVDKRKIIRNENQYELLKWSGIEWYRHGRKYDYRGITNWIMNEYKKYDIEIDVKLSEIEKIVKNIK